jgi:hypothetical protein
MKFCYSLCFILVFTTFAANSSHVFTGIAQHKNENAAKQQALSDLQQTIFVNVESKTLSKQNNAGEDIFIATSKLTSTIPLISATTECYQIMDMYNCEAKLDGNKALKSYRSALQHQQQIIEQNWQQTKSITSNSIKYQELATLLVEVHKAQQLALVLSIIEPNSKVPSLAVSRVTISEQMQTLSQSASSLEMLATLLVEKLQHNQQATLIKPFTPAESSEVTPFASALQTQLSNLLPSAVNQQSAQLTLEGKYRISNKQLNIEASLVDRDGKYVRSAVVSIDKQAIKQFDYQPKQPNFDQLLYSGQIISNNFKVKLQTDKGMRNLLFKKGESVRLLIKVSQPAYYYAVGHTNNTTHKMSYLLDLQEVNDDNRFIKYISAEHVNHWVEIAEFEVIAPFGQEVLQVFASTIKPNATLPQTRFDGDYYVIKGSMRENIAKTRGFKRKQKSLQSQPVIAEAVLNITTSEL